MRPSHLDRNPAARDGIDAVPHGDLTHTSWGENFGSHPTWHAWLQTAGLKPPSRGKGYRVGRSSLVLDLTRQGLGAALGQRMMAADDLSAGRLVPLSDIGLALGHPSCLASPRAKGRKRHVQALANWLTDAAGRKWHYYLPAFLRPEVTSVRPTSLQEGANARSRVFRVDGRKE